MRRMRNAFVLGVFMMSLLLNGCGKSGQIVTVQYPEETENKEMSSVKEIYEYETQTFWKTSYKKQIKKQSEYENKNNKMMEQFFSEQGIYQNLLDSSGNIWLTTMDKEDINCKNLEKGNGFYQDIFSVLEANTGQWKIWVSPEAHSRMVRGYDSDKQSFYLYLEKSDGTKIPVIKEISLAKNYDIRCLWSEDGSRAFIQLVSAEIYPETKEDNAARCNLDSEGCPENGIPLIEHIAYGEVWMLTETGGEIEAGKIYTKSEEEQYLPDMVASKDGKQLLLYLSWESDKILCDRGKTCHHTAIYLKEASHGEWQEKRIPHFNSKKGEDKHYHRVHYVDLLLREDMILCVTDQGQLERWDPQEQKRLSSEKVLKKGYKCCKIYVSKGGKIVIYTSLDENIYEYQYNEKMEVWDENEVYYAPAEAQIFSMKLFDLSGNLFVTYILGGLGKESARMQMVLLQISH